MRTAGLFVTLGATLNFAFADVVCKSEALHYKPRIIPTTEKAGFIDSIAKLCSTSKTDEPIQDRSGSTVFTITRTQGTFSSDDCKVQFNSIVDECVIRNNMGGGSLVADGLTLEVYTDTSNNGAIERRAPPSKATTKKPTTKKPAAEKKPPKANPSKTKSAATKPSATKSAATPSKPAATPTPAGKACGLKGGKGKNTKDQKTKDQKTKDKKTARQIVDSLISTILRRASPAKPPGSPSNSIGSCFDDEPMSMLPGWGDQQFFGFQNEPFVGKPELLKMAQTAYNEVLAKKPNAVILVAALFVPDQGVYLATVPHGATAEQKMRAEAPVSAPTLWQVLGDRSIKDSSKSLTLYHAEDAAMWYAYKKGAVPPGQRFPSGSLMVTFGKIGGGGQAVKIPACNEETSSNIDPHCKQTLKIMGVKEI